MPAAGQVAAAIRPTTTSPPPANRPRPRPPAVVHGLAGGVITAAADQEHAVEERLAEWRMAFRPVGAREEWLVRQAALQSVRLDACLAEQEDLRERRAYRAALDWDADRRKQAEALGATLARRPPLVVSCLRGTRQGCDWLAERWAHLARVAAEDGGWTDAQIATAFDLLGVPNKERRGHPWNEAAGETPATLAERQLRELERARREVLIPLDEYDREVVMRGGELSEATDRQAAELRRFEAACWRRLLWAERQLRDAQRRRLNGLDPEPEEADEPDPTPEPVPVPVSTREPLAFAARRPAPAPNADEPAAPSREVRDKAPAQTDTAVRPENPGSDRVVSTSHPRSGDVTTTRPQPPEAQAWPRYAASSDGTGGETPGGGPCLKLGSGVPR